MWVPDESIEPSPQKDSSINKMRLLRKYRRRLDDLYWDTGLNKLNNTQNLRTATDTHVQHFREQYMLNKVDRCKYDSPKQTKKLHVNNLHKCADVSEPFEYSSYRTCVADKSKNAFEISDSEMLLICTKAEREFKSVNKKIKNKAPRTLENIDTVSENDCHWHNGFKSFANSEVESSSVFLRNHTVCTQRHSPGEFNVNIYSNLQQTLLQNISEPDVSFSESMLQANAFPSKILPNSICRPISVPPSKISFNSRNDMNPNDGQKCYTLRNGKMKYAEGKMHIQHIIETPFVESEIDWNADIDFFINFKLEDALKLPTTQSEKKDDNCLEAPEASLKSKGDKFHMASRKDIYICEKAKAKTLIHDAVQENVDILKKPPDPTISKDFFRTFASVQPQITNICFESNDCVRNIVQLSTPFKFNKGKNALGREESGLKSFKMETSATATKIESTASKEDEYDSYKYENNIDTNLFVHEKFKGFCTASKKRIQVSNDARLRAAKIITESSEGSGYVMSNPQTMSKSANLLDHNNDEGGVELSKIYSKDNQSSGLEVSKRKFETDNNSNENVRNILVKQCTFHNRLDRSSFDVVGHNEVNSLS